MQFEIVSEQILDFKKRYGCIFNFLTFKIWEIDLLGTCNIHSEFETCSTCRTAELEIPIPIFIALVLQITSSIAQETSLNNNCTLTSAKNTGV